MIKQVILFRKRFPDGKGGTFSPRVGKIAAQCAHASLKVFFDRKVNPRLFELLGRIPFLRSLRYLLVIRLNEDMLEWVFGIFAKIVLSVENEADLLRAYKLAQEAGLPCALIQDMGATEFHGVPTYTTVAIGPARAELIDPITGQSIGAIKTSLA